MTHTHTSKVTYGGIFKLGSYSGKYPLFRVPRIIILWIRYSFQVHNLREYIGPIPERYKGAKGK